MQAEQNAVINTDNIELAKKCLNWQPSVPLHDGLKRTIGYFEQLLSSGPT